MTKTSIHVIVTLIVNLYEFEKGNIAPELLVLLVLLGFSYSMLINVLSNQRVKLALFAFGILFLIMFPQFIFLLPLLAPSAYFNFNKVSFIIFLPFFSNFHVLYLMLVGLMLLWDILLVSKDVEVANLKKEKYNLIDDVNRLSESIDLLRVEKERDETLTFAGRKEIVFHVRFMIRRGICCRLPFLNLKALSMTTGETETKENLLELKETLEEGLQDIRRVMYDLRDISFDLENKIMELEPVENSNLTYIVTSNLSYGVKYDIYAIVRESLTNYIKHSDGEHFKVYLSESDPVSGLKSKTTALYRIMKFRKDLACIPSGINAKKEIGNLMLQQTGGSVFMY